MTNKESKTGLRLTAAVLFALSLGAFGAPASACSAEPYIGSVCMFAGKFAPKGYAFAHGQLLPVQKFTSLFAVIGTTYGGDGKTTFALPDLRGRTPLGFGTGTGLSTHHIGQAGGQEYIRMGLHQMPSHSHATAVQTTAVQNSGNTTNPEGAFWASDERDDNYYTGPGSRPVQMSEDTVEVYVGYSGESAPVKTMPPYLVVNWIIAIQGLYPVRNE